VRSDVRRYFELESRDGAPGLLEKIRIVLDTPGLQAGLVYRFGSLAYRLRLLPLRVVAKVLYVVLRKLCIIAYGIEIDATAEIGGGLYIGHQGGVVIGPARIGIDCNISHQVTIGRRIDGSMGVPVLGDRVWIGTGSVLFGAITIGDGVTVAPLTVVSRDLPPRVLAMGNPVRVVKTDHDNSGEIYGAARRARSPVTVPEP
jgi:serine O-acetyltransferase